MKLIRFKTIFYSLLVILALGLFWLWTPDSNYADTLEKYRTPESQFVTLDNELKLHYRDAGNAEGPALVLIHGTSDSLLTWEQISPLLAEKYRLISLDLPGHGFSGPYSDATYSRLAFAQTVFDLLDHLQVEQAILTGNSLGGHIAWRAALLQPSRVSALILLDPSGAPRTGESKSNLGFRLLGTEIGRFLGRKITPRFLIEKSLLGTVTDASIVTETLTDRYWELLRLPGNRQALTDLALSPREPAAWEQIHTISVPSLIVWGADDQLIPVASGTLFDNKLPDSELLVYPDIGHLPMIEAPVQLAQDIHRFLGQPSQTAQ